jgi:hypothetical protein
MPLAQLEKTPGILREMIAGLTAEDLAWKPAPDRFSIAEVLTHLAHTERVAYRPKYESFASDDRPDLKAYDVDALVASGAYSGQDAIEALAEFERLRASSLEFLRSLPPGAAERVGHHRRVGDIRLIELLNECAYHDLGHIRQIAELTRARKYYPNMGAYSKYYSVNP